MQGFVQHLARSPSMATTTLIRPSIGRIANPTKNCHVVTSPLLAILSTHPPQICRFSSTPERTMRKPRRDNNRLRGVSVMRRSGPRFRMNIGKHQIPKPADYKPDIKVDPNHGLWDFFYSKDEPILTPEKNAEHGRGWSVEELRHKSWDDLHRLWWVCVKEQNRISTMRKEGTRMKLQDGKDEMNERLQEVRITMKAIKHALTERFYLWEDARRLAEKDPEIDLTSRRNPYTPADYLEEQVEGNTDGTEAEALGALEGQQGSPDGREGHETSGSYVEPEKVDPSTLGEPTAEPQQPSTRA
ncbi:MRP-L47-domain-containing protein [Whalleya microplaca]|nr:MRP-L47-domain-containing protein [Whalleya microplaca]